MCNPIDSTATTPSLSSLVAHFEGLPDPRINRTKDHKLLDLLVIAICTLLCGGESFNDMEEFGKAKLDWFKTFLELPQGIPSHDTFNRLFAALNPQQFLDCFLRWTQSLRTAIAGEIVAIDGKALRRALNRGQSAKYIVNAWAHQNGLVLGQLKVADKSNEITAVPELLRALELAGCIVTVDAMGCQKKIAKEIVEADADYVLALKGNQETVHQEVKSYLDDAIARQTHRLPPKSPAGAIPELDYTETIEKDHGRMEIRRYWHSDRLAWFADLGKWEKLTSVGVVESVREVTGETKIERRYYLSSLPRGAQRFAMAVRGHWGVENQLHWVLDVCFGEDQSRARTGYAAENLATLRRLALNILRRETTKKRGIKGKQKCAGWDHSYLLRLLGLYPQNSNLNHPAESTPIKNRQNQCD
jgi:predicted transposase YbfD/YdcC